MLLGGQLRFFPYRAWGWCWCNYRADRGGLHPLPRICRKGDIRVHYFSWVKNDFRAEWRWCPPRFALGCIRLAAPCSCLRSRWCPRGKLLWAYWPHVGFLPHWNVRVSPHDNLVQIARFEFAPHWAWVQNKAQRPCVCYLSLVGCAPNPSSQGAQKAQSSEDRAKVCWYLPHIWWHRFWVRQWKWPPRW